MGVQVSDLRIGNWILNGGGKPMQCTAPRICDIDNKLVISEPIPLTPEILEKCGFKNTMGDYWVKDNELMLALDKVWWWTNSWESDGEFGFDTLAQYKEIEYLHQLQNLYYSLTQTEIPITL